MITLLSKSKQTFAVWVRMKSCDSCDTFVVLADRGQNVIFGKNSDRPLGEVQEVVLVPAKLRPKGKLQVSKYK